MLFYRAALPLSSRTLTFAAGIIRRHRTAIGSPWRKLNAGQQALLVLKVRARVPRRGYSRTGEQEGRRAPRSPARRCRLSR